MAWEKGRQLKQFTKEDGTVISYTYNANGIRTSKTVGGVKHEFVLDGTKILRETWDGNTLTPLYDNEESVCGIVYNNVPYYFLENLQGDVIAIVDKNAQTVARYTYDAWGVCTIVTDTSGVDIATINPFRYRGYYYDTEIGLYYLQSRYYDANMGRFVNADSCSSLFWTEFSVLHNFLCYCKNSPCNLEDHSGYGQYAIVAKPSCAPKVTAAIEKASLQNKAHSVYKKEVNYTSIEAGKCFTYHVFTHYYSPNYLRESRYLVGAMTKKQWEDYLDSEYRTLDDLAWCVGIANEAFGAMVPAPDNFVVYSAFALDLLLKITPPKRKYINNILGKYKKTCSEKIYIAFSVETTEKTYYRDWLDWRGRKYWHTMRKWEAKAW